MKNAVHVLTEEDKTELQGVMALIDKAKGMYLLIQDELLKAKDAYNAGEYSESAKLYVRARKVEIRAIEIELEYNKKHLDLLKRIAAVEGWNQL